MRTSEKFSKLPEVLVQIQHQIEGAVKSADNPFFKSKYVPLPKVQQILRPILKDYGVGYVQFPITKEDINVRAQGENQGPAYRGGCLTRVIHEEGEWMEAETLLPLVQNDPQAAGSAFTYAKRYALSAIFGLPEVDDDAESAMFRDDNRPKPDEIERLQNRESHFEARARWAKEIAEYQDAIDSYDISDEIGHLVEAFAIWYSIPDDDRIAIYSLAPTKAEKAGLPPCLSTHERSIQKTNEWNEAKNLYFENRSAA